MVNDKNKKRNKKKIEPIDPLKISENLGYKTYRRETRKPWTQVEDMLLTKLVEENLAKHNINIKDSGVSSSSYGETLQWDLISRKLDGRKPKDCRKRWSNSLDPNLKKGRWSKDEDALLLNAFKTHGSSWQKVALDIPGRTDDQCAKRYIEVLDPSMSEDRLRVWTTEEDLQLIKLVRRHGTRWRIVSSEMNSRPPLTCRNRWRKVITDVTRHKADPQVSQAVRSIDNITLSSPRKSRPSPPPPQSPQSVTLAQNMLMNKSPEPMQNRQLASHLSPPASAPASISISSSGPPSSSDRFAAQKANIVLAGQQQQQQQHQHKQRPHSQSLSISRGLQDHTEFLFGENSNSAPTTPYLGSSKSSSSTTPSLLVHTHPSVLHRRTNSALTTPVTQLSKNFEKTVLSDRTVNYRGPVYNPSTMQMFAPVDSTKSSLQTAAEQVLVNLQSDIGATSRLSNSDQSGMVNPLQSPVILNEEPDPIEEKKSDAEQQYTFVVQDNNGSPVNISDLLPHLQNAGFGGKSLQITNFQDVVELLSKCNDLDNGNGNGNGKKFMKGFNNGVNMAHQGEMNEYEEDQRNKYQKRPVSLSTPFGTTRRKSVSSVSSAASSKFSKYSPNFKSNYNSANTTPYNMPAFPNNTMNNSTHQMKELQNAQVRANQENVLCFPQEEDTDYWDSLSVKFMRSNPGAGIDVNGLIFDAPHMGTMGANGTDGDHQNNMNGQMIHNSNSNNSNGNSNNEIDHSQKYRGFPSDMVSNQLPVSEHHPLHYEQSIQENMVNTNEAMPHEFNYYGYIPAEEEIDEHGAFGILPFNTS